MYRIFLPLCPVTTCALAPLAPWAERGRGAGNGWKAHLLSVSGEPEAMRSINYGHSSDFALHGSEV
jgi:hypothetical protein